MAIADTKPIVTEAFVKLELAAWVQLKIIGKQFTCYENV
jgi:hypothetical protein